jgi:hypothetical protein
MHATR